MGEEEKNKPPKDHPLELISCPNKPCHSYSFPSSYFPLLSFHSFFLCCFLVIYRLVQWFSSATPGHLLEMQILRPHHRPTELETLEEGLAICVLTSPPGDSKLSDLRTLL